MIYLLIAALLAYTVHKFFNITNLYNPFIVFFLYHTFFLFIALSYQEKYAHFIVIETSTKLLILSSYITIIIGAVVSTLAFKSIGFDYFPLKKLRYEGGQSKNSNYAGYFILLAGFLIAINYIIDTGGLLFFKTDMENSRIIDRQGRGLQTLLSISFIRFGFLISIFDNRSAFFKTILFILSCFFLISFGNRAAMLELSIMAFVLLCVYKQIVVKIKYLAYIGAVVFSLLVLFGAMRAGSSYGLYELFVAQFGWRPFVNIQNLQWIIDFFPAEMEHLHGKSILIELKLFFPGSNPNFGSWLKEIMNLNFPGGSITTSHLGIAYINFGYAGALLFPFFLGFLFQSIYILMIRSEANSKLKFVFMSMLSLALGGTLSSGLLSVLIMNVMFLCFVVLVYVCLTYLFRLIVFLGKDDKKGLSDIY